MSAPRQGGSKEWRSLWSVERCNRAFREGERRGPSKDGYVSVSIVINDRRYALQEHRLVMERMLARPLEKHENVHHLNGVKDDNHPANLELWASSQPAGQRIEDLLAWASKIIETYGPDAERLAKLRCEPL